MRFFTASLREALRLASRGRGGNARREYQYRNGQLVYFEGFFQGLDVINSVIIFEHQVTTLKASLDGTLVPLHFAGSHLYFLSR